MTTAELLRSMKVPDTKSIFVLGCLESRVTMLAQQIRALNLVDAIVDVSGYKSLPQRTLLYGSALWLFNPRNTNGVSTFRTARGEEVFDFERVERQPVKLVDRIQVDRDR